MTTRHRVLLPLSALLVAALIAGLTWTLSSRDRDPAVLRLLGAGGASTDVGIQMMGGAESRSAGSNGYRLTGELPTERPADSPVHELAGPFDTSRLERALSREGLTRDRASWHWSSSCTRPALGAPEPPDGREGDSSSVGCAMTSKDDSSTSSGTTEPAPAASSSAVPPPASEPGKPVSSPPQPPPSPEPTTPSMTDPQARATAEPVFEAVGLTVGDAQVSITPYGASVWLDPIVTGLRTVGYTTRVEIDRSRQITWASGYVGAPTRGDSYPMVTAREAFDSIDSPPVTDMMCRVGPDGKGCLPPPEQEITGAELGLQLRLTGSGDQVLVPAWLFVVKGWTEPLGQVAVADRFLGEPEPTENPEPGVKDPGAGQSEPGSGSGGSVGSDGSTPGQDQTEPTSVEPAKPAKP